MGINLNRILNAENLTEFIKKQGFLIYSFIFLTGMILGLTNIGFTSRNILLEEVGYNNQTFFRILINNLLLGISLFIGFIFFNIYNVAVVSFNGLMWGFYLNKFINNLGFSNSLLLFMPHAILEFYWIISFCVYSTKLSFDFYSFLTSGFVDRTIIKSIISITTLKLFALIIISAFIETYLTSTLFNLLNS